MISGTYAEVQSVQPNMSLLKELKNSKLFTTSTVISFNAHTQEEYCMNNQLGASLAKPAANCLSFYRRHTSLPLFSICLSGYVQGIGHYLMSRNE